MPVTRIDKQTYRNTYMRTYRLKSRECMQAVNNAVSLHCGVIGTVLNTDSSACIYTHDTYQPYMQAVDNAAWLHGDFISTVQQRGAAVINGMCLSLSCAFFSSLSLTLSLSLSLFLSLSLSLVFSPSLFSLPLSPSPSLARCHSLPPFLPPSLSLVCTCAFICISAAYIRVYLGVHKYVYICICTNITISAWNLSQDLYTYIY